MKYTSLLMLTASAVSATVCPLLSARLWIAVSTELLVYPASMLGAVIALALLVGRGSEIGSRICSKRNLVSVLIGAVAILLIVTVWRYSNDLFFRFSAARISEEAGKALDKEMMSLGERKFIGESDDAVQVLKRDLPPFFSDFVGRDGEFAYGLAQKDSSSDINIGVVYGYKARRWGVFRGRFIASKWPNARTRRLHGNTFYFVTSDY